MSAAEEWESYTTVCRLCMQRDGFMFGIFNHIQDKGHSIYKKIIDCTTLEVASGDGLPSSICHRCLYKIEFCLEFREQCLASDATLRQINGVSSELLLPSMAQPRSAGATGVVMVVDPNAMFYESEEDSETGNPPSLTHASADHPLSDVETLAATDFEFKDVHMCQYCDRAFSDLTECARHETESHDAEEPYHCALCDRNYGDRNSYSTHLKAQHQSDKPYACPECERSFARRSDLRKHTIVHTGIKPFTCPICLKSFSRNTNLSKHIRIHKDGQEPIVCHGCPRTFISRVELARHAGQHAARPKPFQCEMCDMGFTRKDKLVRHQKRHLPQENVKDVALELQAMRESLMNEYGMPDFAIAQDSNDNHIAAAAPLHEAEVEGEAEVEAEAEAEGDAEDADADAPADEENAKDDWPSTENLVISIDPFTNAPTQDKPPQSPTHEDDVSDGDGDGDGDGDDNSNLSDDNPDEIKEEMDIDDDGGKLEYSQSSTDPATGDCFSSANEDGERPLRHPCTLCNKKFRSADSLQLHMGLHSGERPFGCNVCGKAFMRRRELDRHGTTHTGVKQFQCDKCEKRFSRKDKLLRHTRIHGRNTERCMLCPATFNRRDGLIQHMKTHVKEEQDQVLT